MNVVKSNNEVSGDLDVVTKDEIIEVKKSMKAIKDDLDQFNKYTDSNQSLYFNFDDKKRISLDDSARFLLREVEEKGQCHFRSALFLFEGFIDEFEEAWEEAERKFVEESEDHLVDFVISHPDDKNIFLLYHIDLGSPDYDYVIIRGKKENKKQIQKVFVDEWMQTSARKYPKGFDNDRYFSDRIEDKISKIDAIIMDKNLDLQWFGINEDEEN